MQLHGSSKINEQGQLEIGGISASSLVNEFSTPLFVYDEDLIRNQCRRFHNILANSGLNYHISYASKAFICKYLVNIMHQENMGLDVVSAGELYNAISAGFAPEKIHLHGNNKTAFEIKYALENNVGCFVVDSFDEVKRLDNIAEQMGKTPRCLIRVTPGIQAHTHEYISTGSTDSKFGFNIDNGQALEGVKDILAAKNLNLIGVHFHIGSQIFGTEGTRIAIDKVFAWFTKLHSELNYTPSVLNIGGGFGIRYTDEDVSYPIETALEEIVDCLKKSSHNYELPIPQLWLEPGRSIVGEAGTTLYTIGTIKDIPKVRTYISVDGGMSDHIRTALYQAKYEVALANKMTSPMHGLYTLAGKCCESGDIIAYDVKLPMPEIGDIAAVSCTGAYHYSMASNYNQMLKPAVVFVKNGTSKLAIKRETMEDLIKNQL